MVIFNDFYHFFITLKNGVFFKMVILVVFKWLKIAKVRPFLRQKGPFIPTDEKLMEVGLVYYDVLPY